MCIEPLAYAEGGGGEVENFDQSLLFDIFLIACYVVYE